VDSGYSSVLAVIAVAVLAPIIASFAARLRVPAVACEIVVGILIGPSVFGWIEMDDALNLIGTFGLGYLLFLAGLEIDLSTLKGRGLRIVGLWLVGLALAVGFGLGFHAFDHTDGPLVLGIALAATSLGLIVPILRDSNKLGTPFGDTVLASGSIGEFGPLLALSIFFSTSGAGPGTQVFLIGVFAVGVAIVGFALARIVQLPSVWSTLDRFADTSSQLNVRAVVLVLLLFLALADGLGFEAILGSFVGGVILRVLDRGNHLEDVKLKSKIDAIGYGFFIPVFFVTSGIKVDARALFEQPWSLLFIPAFLVAMLIARGVPSLWLGGGFTRKEKVAAGLLAATNLSIPVVVVSVATEVGKIDSASAAALIVAGVVSVVLLPPIANALLPDATPLAADWDERNPL